MKTQLHNQSRESKTTARANRGSKNQGWTLFEILMVVAILSACSVAVTSLYGLSVSSFASLSNFSIQEQQVREMTRLVQEVREARSVVKYGANPPTLGFQDADGKLVIYTYNAELKQVLRDSSDGSHRLVLENCNDFSFSFLQQSRSKAGFGAYEAVKSFAQSSPKLLEISWHAGMDSNVGASLPSETPHSMRVLVRQSQLNGL